MWNVLCYLSGLQLRLDEAKYVLDPMDFGSIHLKISNLATSNMAKLSRNINTIKTEEMVFNFYSKEQCMSNASDTEHSDDTVETKKATHDRRSEQEYSNLIQCFRLCTESYCVVSHVICHIKLGSSFDHFSTMFTNELFKNILPTLW
jgi:NADH:ubiquinone oxidoreductase subunit F (NADH-binding)